jgi:hypothetical protein
VPVSNLAAETKANLRAIGIELAPVPGLPENIAAVQGKVTSRGGLVYALLEVVPTAAETAAETLEKLRQDGLITDWVAPPVLPGENVLVSVMLRPEQGTDWLLHLDRSSTALVPERPSQRKPEHLRNGGRHHVWAGQDPLDDGDDRET